MCTAGETRTAQLLQRTEWRVLKKLKIELSYHLTAPLLSIYLKELKAVSQSGIYTPTFIAAVFTIAKRWKQSNCPARDEWINQIWAVYIYVYMHIYIHTHIHNVLLLNLKKEILIYLTTWINLKDILLSHTSQ